MANVVVVGAQWGDEGKGKIVDWLASRADAVVRFQGGHNAGHTLVVGDQIYKLSLLPSGIVRGTLSVIGKDTVPAMQAGLYWGYIGLIEGIVARVKAEYGEPMTVIATGGLGRVFYRQTPAIDHYDPDLTIRGLVQIYTRNKAGYGA